MIRGKISKKWLDRTHTHRFFLWSSRTLVTMNPYRKLFAHLEDCREDIRRVCFAILFDNLQSISDLNGFMGHSAVERFEQLVQELAGSDSKSIARLQKDCRLRWQAEIPASSEIVDGPGLQAVEDNSESPLIAKAYDYLESGFLTETTALQIACLIKAEMQGAHEVKTSDVTTLLRAYDYKIPNPAALVRSLADRAEPVLEIHEEKIGPRQELQFRLLPKAEAALRRGILGKKAIDAA